MSGKRDEKSRWARHRLPGNFGLGKRGKHEGAEEVRAEVLDNEAGDEPELNRRIRGLVISRRTALTLPAVLAGMGILGTFGIATPASATVYDQWVESLSSEGKTAIQKSYYYVSSTPAADGSTLVKVRTTLYHKTSSNGVVRWQSTKDFYDQYDGGRKVGHIGEDWRDVPRGQTLEQGTEFYLRGGGTHHITSTETDFRGNSGVFAGWEFWVDIPFTGHVGVEVWPFAPGPGNSATPISYNVIHAGSHHNHVMTYPNAHTYQAFDDGANVAIWDEYARYGQAWFNRPADGAAPAFNLIPYGAPQMALDFDWDNPDWTSLNTYLWSRANGAGTQQWHMDSLGGRLFRLWPNVWFPQVSGQKSWGTDTALDLNNNDATNGEQIHLLDWRNNAAQKWYVEPVAAQNGNWGVMSDWPKKWTRPIGQCVVGLYRDEACRSEIARITIAGTSTSVHAGGYFGGHAFSSAGDAVFVKLIKAPEHFVDDGIIHPVRIAHNTNELNIAMISLVPKRYRARFWRLAVGATADNGLVFEKSVWAGEGVTPPANPTRAGYTFDGWNPSKGWEALWSDMDFLAVWVPIPYTVTWKDGVTGKVYKTGKYNYGSVVPAKEYPGADEHEGYRKDNWDRQPGFHMPAHDVVITFNYVRQYTVHYMVDGSEDTSLRDERIDVNTTYTIPAEKARKAAKPNCDPGFDGWYSEQARRNKVTQVKVTGDVWVWAVNRVTVSYVVVTLDGGGHKHTSTIHTVTKNYGDTITSTDGGTGTALEIAKRINTDKVIEHSDKWYTDEGKHNRFTTMTVGGNTSIYLFIQYSAVEWYCDGEDAAHMVDHQIAVPQGTWIAPSSTAQAKASRPNCTPGWVGWYTDPSASALHPERSASRMATFAARAMDSKFVGQYLGEATLKLYSANIATVSFARAAGSEPVPETDVTYRRNPSLGATTLDGELRIPSAVQRRVESTLPFKAFPVAYKEMGDGRWRTYKPDAWHANADCSDAKKSATTVSRDATYWAMWREVTTDGVVDNRA